MTLPIAFSPRIAVIGAGPVGLSLALHAARLMPAAAVTVFDARPIERDVGADPRTLALSLGSVQFLKRLRAWPAAAAQPIAEVHVSQQPPTFPWGTPQVLLNALDEGVPMLGAVMRYGALLAPLQAAWLQQAASEPARLQSRFGTPVSALKRVSGGVEVDAGIAETFDVAVVAEGGVFSRAGAQGGTARLRSDGLGRHASASRPAAPPPPSNASRAMVRRRCCRCRRTATGSSARRSSGACRRTTIRCATSTTRSAWPCSAPCSRRRRGASCVSAPLKDFALGMNAERTLVQGRTVRIGNAAQTLHPVAGQGLNLGLRDAASLVHALRESAAGRIDSALRRVEWHRAPDRWSMIAVTDFLARSFTWQAPGLPAARGLALALLQAATPLKSALARQMMFGRR